MRVDVIRATQSPMNAKRWCLDLSCGHDGWVDGARRPRARTFDCRECSAPPRILHIDPDFRRDPETGLYCLVCQKDIKPTSEYSEVFYIDGDRILHPGDVGLAGKLTGVLEWVPVGPDCARRIGPEWTRPAIKNNTAPGGRGPARRGDP